MGFPAHEANDSSGWTGNPARNLGNRAGDIGLDYGEDTRSLTQMDVYKLTNAFAHVDWMASSTRIGMENAKGTD